MKALAIGDISIEPLVETEHCFVDVPWLFGALTPEDMARNSDWLGPDMIDIDKMKLGFSFQAFVVRTKHHNILIDSCNGNHKQRPTAAWQHDLRSDSFMNNLKKLGLQVEDIDYVMCTHLHCDHVGWNTRLENGRWVPTFPNARYIFGREEFEFCNDLHNNEPDEPVHRGSFIDSVLPVVEAGLVDIVSSDHELFRQLDSAVYLAPAFGHSIGHVCVHAKSADSHAVIIGDAVHHAIQFDMPELVMRADYNPAMAVETRRNLMDFCVEKNAFFLAGHIPNPTIGKVQRKGENFRLIKAEY